jgi:pyruvate/2-oxoglutarate dehydrogenase complex dihydrolipoamide acyltransferase (E2) component
MIPLAELPGLSPAASPSGRRSVRGEGRLIPGLRQGCGVDRIAAGAHDWPNKTLMDTFLIDVPMPSMGATVNELTVVTLKIQPGAHVAKGQKLGELESDKSIFEFESPCEGTVRRRSTPSPATRSPPAPLPADRDLGHEPPAPEEQVGPPRRIPPRPLPRPRPSGRPGRRSSPRRRASTRPRSPTSRRPAPAAGSRATTSPATSRRHAEMTSPQTPAPRPSASPAWGSPCRRTSGRTARS